MAGGDDLSLFNRHRPNLQNLLRHSGIPESNHRLWIGLYRIGATQDEANTVIVVSCNEQRIRKLVRDLLRSCPMFQQGGALAQFKIISKAAPPETICEPQLTMQYDTQADSPGSAHAMASKPFNQDFDQNLQNKITLRLYKSCTEDNYLCRQVQALHRSDKGVLENQSATAGPLIWLNGHTYQLTVEHVVNFDSQKTHVGVEHASDHGDDWDDDDDNDSDVNGFLVDESVAPWNIGDRLSHIEKNEADLSDSLSSNSTRELSTEQCTHDVATNRDVTKDESYKRSNETLDHMVGASTSTSHPLVTLRSGDVRNLIIQDTSFSVQTNSSNSILPCHVSQDLDYLLIPVTIESEKEPCTHGISEIVQLSDTFNVYEQTEARTIVMATASLGYVLGTLFPAPTLLRAPKSQNFQTFFCIKSEDAMYTGTSGSAVFDRETGLLAGYIVLGCSGKDIWYMKPISDVLDDLKVIPSSIARCQIQLNTPSMDSLSVVSTLSMIVTTTLQSSKALLETILSFRNHRSSVSDLVRELRSLELVLRLLEDNVRADETTFLPLKFPLIQCRKACMTFQELVKRRSMRSGSESRMSFRDWAKLTYMNGDIISFKEMLAGYTLTINVAMADANLSVTHPNTRSLSNWLIGAPPK
ncbi:hypothetical protein NW758_015126 [Fusarium oxysporum]|nr:hypothetical protein NW758_015126 [Fusarium oxysporum]